MDEVVTQNLAVTSDVIGLFCELADLMSSLEGSKLTVYFNSASGCAIDFDLSERLLSRDEVREKLLALIRAWIREPIAALAA